MMLQQVQDNPSPSFNPVTPGLWDMMRRSERRQITERAGYTSIGACRIITQEWDELSARAKTKLQKVPIAPLTNRSNPREHRLVFDMVRQLDRGEGAEIEELIVRLENQLSTDEVVNAVDDLLNEFALWQPGLGMLSARSYDRDRPFLNPLEQYNLEVIPHNPSLETALEAGITRSADVCMITPPVCVGNLGVSRLEMPQLGGLENNFLEYEERKGNRVVTTERAVGELKATQKEINANKVLSMLESYRRGTFPGIWDPIIVSGDDYILDGHHRWATLLIADPSNLMEVHQVDAPMVELYRDAMTFPGVTTAGLNNPRGPSLSSPKVKQAVALYEDFNMKGAKKVFKDKFDMPADGEPWVYMGKITEITYESDKEGIPGQLYVHKLSEPYPKFYSSPKGLTTLIDHRSGATGRTPFYREGWMREPHE